MFFLIELLKLGILNLLSLHQLPVENNWDWESAKTAQIKFVKFKQRLLKSFFYVGPIIENGRPMKNWQIKCVKDWHGEATWPCEKAPNNALFLFCKFELAQRSHSWKFPPEISFDLLFGSGKSDVNTNWHSDATWPWEQVCNGIFFFKICKFDLARGGQWTKFVISSHQQLITFWLHNSCFGFCLEIHESTQN